MRYLGAHMSIAGGVDKAIERGNSIGCTAIQIFVKNNNQWAGRPLSEEEVENFRKLQKETGIFVFAHTGYLINLASPKEDIHHKSMASMLDELKRCEALGIPFIVLHPGSHLGEGEEYGIKKILKSLDHLFKQTEDFKVKVLLETTAGQGSNLGYKFEQLRAIIDGTEQHSRIGACFDTCHAFAAGYDIKSEDGYKTTWKRFDDIIGLKKLMVFHLNDTKKGLASKLDRHEHIGKGELGLEAFRMIMNDKRFETLPMVLETPKEEDLKEDIGNLETLRNMIA